MERFFFLYTEGDHLQDKSLSELLITSMVGIVVCGSVYLCGIVCDRYEEEHWVENIIKTSSLAAQRNVCASPPFVLYTILPAVT